MTMSPKILVERFYHQVWNQADEAEARRILHADFRFRASLGPDHVGPDGFIAYMRQIHAALAEYTCTIETLLVEDNRAAARMRFTGRHQAEFFGIPATGRTITWTGGAFFVTDAAQITELWVLGDIDAVKRQLGVGVDRGF